MDYPIALVIAAIPLQLLILGMLVPREHRFDRTLPLPDGVSFKDGLAAVERVAERLGLEVEATSDARILTAREPTVRRWRIAAAEHRTDALAVEERGRTRNPYRRLWLRFVEGYPRRAERLFADVADELRPDRATPPR